MNLSMRWLREFVDADISPAEYADAMTMSGSKVEGYAVEGEQLSKIVVGKIIDIQPHPDADKLLVCKVDAGGEPLQIVTGARNLKTGDFVPAALHGSTLAGGKSIKKGKLRGVMSEGMLCSVEELGLTRGDFPDAPEDGIMVISEPCTPGQDIKEALGYNDTVVEFEITSNRPDCLSVIGLARETAATLNKPLRLYTPEAGPTSGDILEHLQVEVMDDGLCPRYMAAMADNVRIKPSPRWMRERLRASGVRPINNIVDITNYVMLEYGQPMHAFDLRFVSGGKIFVRRAEKGESITTLDGIQRPLSENMLVIADTEKPVAVAGVMGGEFSGIMEDTTRVVFECANFGGASVRTTAKALGMRTDSSARFEKGLDPNLCEQALARACELVRLLGAGDIIGNVIDCRAAQKPPLTLPLDAEAINRLLGADIPAQRMKDILTSLFFGVDGDMVRVPTWRGDVECMADLAEEVARIYGYDKIPVTEIRGTAEGKLTGRQKFERDADSLLLAAGYSQIITYSFVSPKYYDKIRMPKDDPRRNSVTILNPLGEDTSAMRTTALPSMLEALSFNYKNRNLTARLYENATEYFPVGGDTLPAEKQRIILGAYGENEDYYSLKGAVEILLERLTCADAEFVPTKENPAHHPGRCAEIYCGSARLGILGEIHPETLENYDIGVSVYAAELDLDAMFELRQTEKSYKPLPKFPSASRDISVMCQRELHVGEMQKAIRAAGGKILASVKLFDVYEGDRIPAGQKSVAFSIVFQADDRTLTDAEADKAVEKIVSALEGMGARLRA